MRHAGRLATVLQVWLLLPPWSDWKPRVCGLHCLRVQSFHPAWPWTPTRPAPCIDRHVMWLAVGFNKHLYFCIGTHCRMTAWLLQGKGRVEDRSLRSASFVTVGPVGWTRRPLGGQHQGKHEDWPRLGLLLLLGFCLNFVVHKVVTDHKADSCHVFEVLIGHEADSCFICLLDIDSYHSNLKHRSRAFPVVGFKVFKVVSFFF